MVKGLASKLETAEDEIRWDERPRKIAQRKSERDEPAA